MSTAACRVCCSAGKERNREGPQSNPKTRNLQLLLQAESGGTRRDRTSTPITTARSRDDHDVKQRRWPHIARNYPRAKFTGDPKPNRTTGAKEEGIYIYI